MNNETRTDSQLSGFSSEEPSPSHEYRIRSYSLSVRDPRFQDVFSKVEAAPWSNWDGSVGCSDSVISFTNMSDVSRLIRDCSVDSDGSEFSLDVSLNEGCGLNTLQVIQRIEEEINSVKNNCLAMNQELFTLHDSSIVSEEDSSESESAVHLKHNRTSFRGLLNLTVIPDEVSDTASNASDSSIVHLVHLFGDEDPFSMEWDNEDLLGSQNKQKPLESKSGCLLEVQANQAVWCSQESGYLESVEWEGTPSSDLGTSTSILTPLQEKREIDESMSCSTTTYSSCLNSPDDSTSVGSSGVVKRKQWAEASQQNRDSAIFDLGLDLEASWREDAVGLAVQLINYAHDTWQAPTPRAHVIKQAYIEVEKLTGCRRMRRMRGDTYGILRASLCQLVLKRLPLPSAHQAFQCITRHMDSGSSDWLRGWTFGHRLPYGPENVLQGMRYCLETLEQTMTELAEDSDAMDSLVSRLNADVVLDTQLMEAIKLHVLSAALSLELAEALGEALPLFALALFSRPDSKSAKELAFNYLNPIGDSSTLEKAEYYLLGYALGVRVDVYRPTAIMVDGNSSTELRTSYPDWESFTSFISVIEEDERHYSVPVP